MPRPRKYDWDDKRATCYKLWVEDRLSAPQIVKWFAEHLHVPESELPTSTQFHHKFSEWRFPRRRDKLPGYDEAALLARMRQLFAENRASFEMHKILTDEGYDLDVRKFRAFRRKHGMLMRNDPGFRAKKGKEADDSGAAGDEVDEGDDEEVEGDVEPAAAPPALPPEEAARRAQHVADLKVKSDELLSTRKRRRRIRGYGHLPADDPNLGPRYSSETSLDECKAYLNLSNDLYTEVRSQYDAICREMGITKMSLCAEGQWQASKDRLIRENMHLSSVLHPLQPNLDKRLNALNCICSDVTKRMRNQAKAMSIADASNLLGLDPLQSKQLRRDLYEILEADHFTTILECGKEHLAELRERWYAKSDVLQQAVASGDPQKMRAIDLLCKDSRKRYCDDQLRKDPGRRVQYNMKNYGPGPGPAQGARGRKIAQANASAKQYTSPPQSTPGRPKVMVGPGWFGQQQVPEFQMSNLAHAVPPIDFDLDPLLTETTHGPPWPPPSAPRDAPDPAAPRPSVAITAYFRLASGSQIIGHHPRMWLGKLTSGVNMEALRKAAKSKAGAATVAKVNGIVKNEDGSEDSWLIESDEELSVYLDEAGEKPTFVVQLEGGYA